jgi:hypothetical protein
LRPTKQTTGSDCSESLAADGLNDCSVRQRAFDSQPPERLVPLCRRSLRPGRLRHGCERLLVRAVIGGTRPIAVAPLGNLNGCFAAVADFDGRPACSQ